MNNLIDLSKQQWNKSGENPTPEELAGGCLQRIANAVEGMQKPYLQLLSDVDYYKRKCQAANEKSSKLEKRIASLKGVITRMKKKKA